MTGPALPDQALDGLLGAFAKLKSDLGYGDDEQELQTAIENFIALKTEENESYQKYAEQAILEAQSLKEANDMLHQEKEELLSEINQLKMDVTVAKTQELTQAAYDYDKEYVESCVAEVEDLRLEAQQLQDRIDELEQENAGLTQTLSEMRQSQHQLQMLQKSVEAGALGTPVSKSVAMSPSETTDFRTPQSGDHSAEAGQVGLSADNTVASNNVGTSQNEAADVSPVRLAFNILPAAAGAAVGAGTVAAIATGINSGSPSSAAPTQSALDMPLGSASDDPLAVAAALQSVAGNAEGGVVATAARMLRSYNVVHIQLEDKKQEADKLKAELDDLHETISSKTFKAPSAWAEREVKYKQDKRKWEEAQKTAEQKLSALQTEVQTLRAGIGAPVLEGRIQDLEAQLLESQREKDAARAALHELQLSMPKEGDAVVRSSAIHGVHQVVEQIESISQSSGAQSAGQSSQKSQGVQFKGIADTPESMPKSSQKPNRLSSRAEDIERKLAQVEGARAQIEAELAAIAAATAAEPSAPVDWEAVKMQREVTFLKKGIPTETASNLAALETELHQLSHEQTKTVGVDLHVDENNRVKLQLDDLAAAQDAAADSNGDAPHPAAEELQHNFAAMNVASETKSSTSAAQTVAAAAAVQQKQDAIVAEIQELVSTENLDAVDLGLTAVLAPAESQKEEPAKQVPAVAVYQELPVDVVARIQELEALLAAKTEAVKLNIAVAGGQPQAGVQPVNFNINVAEQEPQSVAPTPVNFSINVNEAENTPVEQPLHLNIAVAKKQAQPEAPIALNFNIADKESNPAEGPVSLNLNLTEQQMAAAAAPVAFNIAVKDQASIPQAPPGAPVLLNLAVADTAARDARIKELEAMLAATKEEEKHLKQELHTLPPLRLHLNVNDAVPSRHSSGNSSNVSLAGYTIEGIAKDRAEAEKAYAEHQKNSDGPSLLRAKLELETRCALQEGQISKLQQALETSEQTKVAMEQQIDTAMETGDVSILGSLKERLRSKSPKKSFKMFGKKKGEKGAPAAAAPVAVPSKEAMATALHDTRDALQETETERNALRRQLARMSEKMKKQTGPPQPGESAGGDEARPSMSEATEYVAEDVHGEDVDMSTGVSEDIETELYSLREENTMLMEELVDTKVKFAETHGDYLEARRSLLRAQEKHLQLQQQLKTFEVQQTQAVAHLRPLGTSLPPPQGGMMQV